MASARVQITVESAKDLYNPAIHAGEINPYVIVEVPGQEGMRFQTPVMSNDPNPVWNFTGELSGIMGGDIVQFEVWDSDTFPKPDDLLGRASLTVADFYPDGLHAELALELSKSGATISVRLVVLRVEELGVVLGPEKPGAQENDVVVDEASIRLQQLAQKYSIMMLKAVAGIVRFTFEDIINGSVQGVFLIKCWPSKMSEAEFTATDSQLAFTWVTIFVGVGLSLVGPIKDICGMNAIRQQSPGQGYALSSMDLGYEVDAETGLLADAANEPGSPALAPVSEEVKASGPQDTKAESSTASPLQKRASLPVLLSHRRLADYLRGADPRARHWREASRGLLISGLAFWVGMALIPVLFGGQMDSSQSVPVSTLLYFFLLSGFCITIEIWVVVHTRHGLLFFQDAVEHMCAALTCKRVSGAMGILALLLSLLGRYDTFSDIVFAMMLLHKKEITWFSVWDHKFQIPLMSLQCWAVFAVVFGVFICQALPGMILLAVGRSLPMAFKFNEFNFLLAITEMEVEED